MNGIQSLTIKGFKSIKNLDDLKLSQLNVLIGANGVGKSNFVSFFRMVSELVEERLQSWVSKHGGVDRVFFYGIKETSKLNTSIRFGANGFDFSLEPSSDEGVLFDQEKLFFKGNQRPFLDSLGSGYKESKLKSQAKDSPHYSVKGYCYRAISNWRVYHFHDTSDTAAVKRLCEVHDDEFLRHDAANLAAFLYRLNSDSPEVYNQIRKTVRLAVPFFDDFILKPRTLDSGEQQIRLLWRQLDNDYPLWPSQLSDGSLRFICLVTALLQPNPPSTIIIDEPELGLHPYAITLLGALIRSASKQTQVIISTQSVPLLNEFELDDVIVVERESGASTFKRLDAEQFEHWLEDYSIGELWQKNILGGRPRK